jgi:hypothetical protein
VRECTHSSYHSALVLATTQAAFARDAEFAKAGLLGKLAIVKTQADERKILADQERTYIERSVLADWFGAQLSAGKPIAELVAEVKTLKDNEQICVFTLSWAEGLLSRLAEFPTTGLAAKTDDAPAKTDDAPAKTDDAPAKTDDDPSKTEGAPAEK